MVITLRLELITYTILNTLKGRKQSIEGALDYILKPIVCGIERLMNMTESVAVW